MSESRLNELKTNSEDDEETQMADDSKLIIKGIIRTILLIEFFQSYKKGGNDSNTEYNAYIYVYMGVSVFKFFSFSPLYNTLKLRFVV